MAHHSVPMNDTGHRTSIAIMGTWREDTGRYFSHLQLKNKKDLSLTLNLHLQEVERQSTIQSFHIFYESKVDKESIAHVKEDYQNQANKCHNYESLWNALN